ncbi:hypothetical protein [Clostridium polynesiense]|uniref:hypothetical protein n=1 Tax=Clostridium polynesiense TaxID=1325933 RepID=UPI00058FCDFF|nr:hypothetical protein [Clostridium polynesiense]
MKEKRCNKGSCTAEVLMLLAIVVFISSFQLFLLNKNIERIKYKKDRIINYSLYTKNIIYAQKELKSFTQLNKLNTLDELNVYLLEKYMIIDLPDFYLKNEKESGRIFLEHKKGDMDRKYLKVNITGNEVILKETFL